MDNSEKMFELADHLKSLRDEKKDAEQRVKDINAALEEVDAALAQLMTDTETQNFTRSRRHASTSMMAIPARTSTVPASNG